MDTFQSAAALEAHAAAREATDKAARAAGHAAATAHMAGHALQAAAYARHAVKKALDSGRDDVMTADQENA